MIPAGSSISAAWLPLDALVVLWDDHQMHLDPGQVAHYINLLDRHAGQDTDPIVVVPHSPTTYRITNGRHRTIAHQLLGRTHIAAVIVAPPRPDALPLDK